MVCRQLINNAAYLPVRRSAMDPRWSSKNCVEWDPTQLVNE